MKHLVPYLALLLVAGSALAKEVTSADELIHKIEALRGDSDWDQIAELVKFPALDGTPDGAYWRSEVKGFFFDDLLKAVPKSKRKRRRNSLRKEIRDGYAEAAQGGHATAAYELAQIYEFGDGVKEDEEKALQYYRLSWKLDSTDVWVGRSFASFLEDCSKRGAEALQIYRQVFDLQDGFEDHCLLRMARIHMRGLGGVAQDFSKGIPLLEAAIELDSYNAKADLAHALAHGQGVERDLERALKLLEEADVQSEGAYEEAVERVHAMIEEANIKAAWDRVVQAVGGEWEFPTYMALFTEDLDLKKPEIRPKGRREEWTTVEDSEGKRRYLSYVSVHDGEGGESWVRYNPDGSEDGRGQSSFDSEGVLVTDYGDFVTRDTFNADGLLIEHKDLDPVLPTQERYSYEQGKLVRIEHRDSDEVQVEEIHYDDRGRLSGILTHLGDGKEVMRRTFTYDNQDRVVRMSRIQEGVPLAWDKHSYSEGGRQETIVHRWIHRKTGEFGGMDVTTREFDENGSLHREVEKSHGPEPSESLREITVMMFDAKGRVVRSETIGKDGSKTTESFEWVWVPGGELTR